MLDDLKAKLSEFTQQRDQVHIQFQQLAGAIFACETMIKQIEEKNKEQHNEEV